jgi:deazaflavin-dependent oxidoreductase (nitroreductase family)
MARRYQLSGKLRFYNRLMKALLRFGWAPRGVYLLTVPGRRTGRPYSTPVTLIENETARWLVAPYGEVGWVRNARAAGQVGLSRGGHRELARLVPTTTEESARVLKTYIGRIAIVRPYFNVRPESSLEDFAAQAPQHPVFRLERV